MQTTPQRTPHKDAKACLGMIAMVLVPTLLTLSTVRFPRTVVDVATNPSPYGYTVSLLLWIIPIVVLGFWFLRHPKYPIQRKAFWRTMAVLIPAGFALDIFFAHSFFTFVNRDATLGIMVPVVGGAVPVEEFLFYALGFIVILLLYVWGDEYWFGAYNVPDYQEEAANCGVSRVINIHWGSIWLGLALILAAYVYKKYFSQVPDGFPGYMAFVIMVAVLPSLLLFRAVVWFINWRALSMTFFMIVLIALIWEATLAAPYQWWFYRPEQMMGIFVDAWCDLPVEAVIVWMSVSFTTVSVYEAIKILAYMDKPTKAALFGNGASGSQDQAS